MTNFIVWVLITKPFWIVCVYIQIYVYIYVIYTIYWLKSYVSTDRSLKRGLLMIYLLYGVCLRIIILLKDTSVKLKVLSMLCFTRDVFRTFFRSYLEKRKTEKAQLVLWHIVPKCSSSYGIEIILSFRVVDKFCICGEKKTFSLCFASCFYGLLFIKFLRFPEVSIAYKHFEANFV